MTTKFEEPRHARDHTGKFTEMAGSAPDGAGLPAPIHAPEHSPRDRALEALAKLDQAQREYNEATAHGMREDQYSYEALEDARLDFADTAEQLLHQQVREHTADDTAKLALAVLDSAGRAYSEETSEEDDPGAYARLEDARLDFADAAETCLRSSTAPVLGLTRETPEEDKVDAVRNTFPWADADAARRIVGGVPAHTSAEPPADAWDNPAYEDGPLPCAKCGEALVVNLDGVRGRWGHAGTDDTACGSRERTATSAVWTSIGSNEFAAARNDTEADRLRGLAFKAILAC
jgi:hypothetical protein